MIARDSAGSYAVDSQVSRLLPRSGHYGISTQLDQAIRALSAVSLCRSDDEWLHGIVLRRDRNQYMVTRREEDFIWLLVCRYHYDVERLPAREHYGYYLVGSARARVEAAGLRRRVAALRNGEQRV